MVNKIKRKCLWCGKEFKVWKLQPRKFCSRFCYGQNKRRMVKKICLGCKKEFEVVKIREKTAKHCSIKCRDTRVEAICQNCHKLFLLYPERLERNAGKFCSDKCRYTTYKLEGNPNWKNGKSFELYPLGWNKTHREQIRFRDGYKCQICAIPEAEHIRRLDVHHIDYNKLNNKSENLISLCVYCHMKTNGKREYWKEYFNAKRKNSMPLEIF